MGITGKEKKGACWISFSLFTLVVQFSPHIRFCSFKCSVPTGICRACQRDGLQNGASLKRLEISFFLFWAYPFMGYIYFHFLWSLYLGCRAYIFMVKQILIFHWQWEERGRKFIATKEVSDTIERIRENLYEIRMTLMVWFMRTTRIRTVHMKIWRYVICK